MYALRVVALAGEGINGLKSSCEDAKFLVGDKTLQEIDGVTSVA